MSTQNTIEVADRMEITELYSAYSWAIDSGDAAGVAALFTADGEFHGSGGAVSRGRDELVAFAQRVAGSRAERLQHVVSTIVIHPANASHARVRTYVHIYIGAEGGSRMLGMGAYEDDVVKMVEGWRFSTRRFENWGWGS